MKFNEYVLNNNLGEIVFDISFKKLTTIGCGGLIDILYYPNNIENLIKAFSFIVNNKLQYFIIGNGSNVLASDDKYNGIVICVKKLKYEYEIINDRLIVSAFFPTIALAYDLAKKRLGDLSFLGGIPGLLGGAIYNNSGAFGDNISKHLISVKYISKSGEIKQLDNKACCFEYRKSIFHQIEGIIIEAELKIEKINTMELLKERKEKRSNRQPLEYKSMGSIFKNNPKIESWRVIDKLNLRGYRINDAMISNKHTNFIVNLGNARTSDILDLISYIQQRSKEELGIILTPEITIVKN